MEWVLITLLILVVVALSLKNQDAKGNVKLDAKPIESQPIENEPIENTLIISNLSIDQILDNGFIAKENEDFKEAAKWFLIALERNPAPDIQVYILMDIYRFWEKIDKKDSAKKMVFDFKEKYYKELPTELQHEFKIWMDKLVV